VNSHTPYGERTIFSRNWKSCDFDGDCSTNYQEYAVIATHYNSSAWPHSIGDIDGNGIVNYVDLGVVATNNGKTYTDNDALTSYPVLESARGFGPGAGHLPLDYGTCDVAHQGLLFDKEFGLYYNRARYLHPTLGRFVQRDYGNEYGDGMSLHGTKGSGMLCRKRIFRQRTGQGRGRGTRVGRPGGCGRGL